MQFVTGVTAALYRYNPGIIAQAFGSLDVLYPGRISLGVGSEGTMNDPIQATSYLEDYLIICTQKTTYTHRLHFC